MSEVIIKCLIDGPDQDDWIDGTKIYIDFNWDKCTGALVVGDLFLKNVSRKEPIDYIKKFDGLKIPVEYSGKTDNLGPKDRKYSIFVLNTVEIERYIKLKDILSI